jgi:hypothetical protein
MKLKTRVILERFLKNQPEVTKEVNNKFSSLFKEMGYLGQYSTELRIVEDGSVYYIDPTCRIPSPPGELMMRMYKNYSKAVDDIANGIVPKLEPVDKYGAEVTLYSDWHETKEILVEFPKEFEKNIALKNQVKKSKNKYICIQNGNGGYFGAVVATGKTIKEVTEKVVGIIGEVKAFHLEYDCAVFDKAGEAIESGERFGIEF